MHQPCSKLMGDVTFVTYMCNKRSLPRSSLQGWTYSKDCQGAPQINCISAGMFTEAGNQDLAALLHTVSGCAGLMQLHAQLCPRQVHLLSQASSRFTMNKACTNAFGSELALSSGLKSVRPRAGSLMLSTLHGICSLDLDSLFCLKAICPFWTILPVLLVVLEIMACCWTLQWLTD